MTSYNSNLIVLSAPSGAGKTTVAKALVSRNPEFAISVSATTRKKREREKEGIDYIFLSEEEFKDKISKNCFLEYEEVHGKYYGTLKSTVDQRLAENKVMVFDIDVNGALSIKKSYPDAKLIFIKAPSREELIRRLKGRKSESIEMIEKRLNRLPFEYEQADKFDYIVINENFNQTVEEIEKIINNN